MSGNQEKPTSEDGKGNQRGPSTPFGSQGSTSSNNDGSSGPPVLSGPRGSASATQEADGSDSPTGEQQVDFDDRASATREDLGVTESDDEVSVAELVEQNEELRHELAMRAVSGPIPDHEDLYKYTPEHQERILRMSESYSTDESKRRDLVVEAQVKMGLRSQIISPVLLLVFGGGAIWAFSTGNNVAGGLLLGIPMLKFFGTFVTTYSLKRAAKREDSED